MKQVIRVLNEEIKRLKVQILESKKNNKGLWEKNQKLTEENKMLRNDLKLLGQHCQELNDNKDK